MKPDPQQPRPVTIPQNLTRAPKSTSFKDLADKESNVPSQLGSVEPAKLSTPFDADDLIRSWDDYAETLVEKAHLKNTMIHCKPVLLADFNFEVIVYNPAQQEELINNSIGLLKIIRSQLKNDRIQMYIRIDTTNEKKSIYTSAEKFEYMNDLNPLLSKLKDEFDLTVE